MDNRREFIKKAALLAGSTGLWTALPASIQKALAINPELGSTFYDAEHVVMLMQENRSFDHCYGTLQGVRGFNDPRAITLPNGDPVWLQTNRAGYTYAPFRLNIKDTKATWMRDLPHSWENQVDARNDGKYDKWLDVKQSGNPEYRDMPLTMGHYTREDIPFYYAFADAFTVCDQHFCSSLTGTTANRMFFWSGKLRDRSGTAHVRNSEVGYSREVDWTTFPERLEQHGVSWKVYQNELSVKTELDGEKSALLANFTDNNLEWFSQYHVRFSPGHQRYLQRAVNELPAEIAQLEKAFAAASGEEAESFAKPLARKRKELEEAKAALARWHPANFDKLPLVERQLHQRAFTTNIDDPDYHQTTTIGYEHDGEQRQVEVPKGDVLHQFRKDVARGELPTVSWLVAPQRFSDHPSSPWYGAWYVSEVLDILTKHPEIWKKTIFILNYDENDGYFDHVPPFVAPNPNDAESGTVSAGIDTTDEFVTLDEELKKPGMKPENARQSAVGLGYRVPLVIASPWSRGGWVNSEVCDITSTLMFLEKFLSHKTGKRIIEPNISTWRRAVCGDLTSAFRPYHGEPMDLPKPVNRDAWMAGIHKAGFSDLPTGFPTDLADLPKQEPGIRDANALPYELYVDERLERNGRQFELQFRTSRYIFGRDAAGAPFSVYAPGDYWQRHGQGEPGFAPVKVWDFAVTPESPVRYQWPLGHFKDGAYALRVYGPNGFYREFAGNGQDADVTLRCAYQQRKGKNATGFSGNVVLHIANNEPREITISAVDNAYGTARQERRIRARAQETLVIDTTASHGWYDVSVRIAGQPGFARRYAGRVETGKPMKTDPYMGRIDTTG